MNTIGPVQPVRPRQLRPAHTGYGVAVAWNHTKAGRQRDTVEVSAAAPGRPKPTALVRRRLISRVRKQIAAGTYADQRKLGFAGERCRPENGVGYR